MSGNASLPSRVRALCDLSVPELRGRYTALSGRAIKTDNRHWLIRSIVRYMTEGRQPEGRNARRALARALDRALAPRTKADRGPPDPRIPPVGSVLRRLHGERMIEVHITRRGFRFEGRIWSSLSAIARTVTGTRWNGLLWFGLTDRKRGRQATGGSA